MGNHLQVGNQPTERGFENLFFYKKMPSPVGFIGFFLWDISV